MQLIRNNDGSYTWVKNGKAKTFPTAVEAMVYGIEQYEVTPREFITATTQMDQLNHNCAEFGIFGAFIYTEKMKHAAEF